LLNSSIGRASIKTEMTTRAAPRTPQIDEWLSIVRARVEQSAPELIDLFDIYAGEARFGRAFIEADLSLLAPGARVLEIGAGALLLSCQLCREGFCVTALEPVGQGFSHFNQLQKIVGECAETKSCIPYLIAISAEEFLAQGPFDYAFSINVMEHVASWPTVLARVTASLKMGAKYHFTCANYLFPYEPHFNIPTLFSKRLTEAMLWPLIRGTKNMPDPEGTWRSLNWITTLAVAGSAARMPGVQISFDRSRLVKTLERAVEDPVFASRRSAWVIYFLEALVRLRLHRICHFIPLVMQPIMDCTIIVVSKQAPSQPCLGYST
jgi:hypothetical protein